MRHNMKIASFFAIMLTAFSISCQSANTKRAKNAAERAKYRESIQRYMAEDATLSTERPAPHLLSEQEVMIKVADYAVIHGYLDPQNAIYQDIPALSTAKAAQPTFVYSSYDLSNGRIAGYYHLYAVDQNGNACLEAYAFAEAETSAGMSAPHYSLTYNQYIGSKHILTKDECERLCAEIFPRKAVSEPIALAIETDASRHESTVWYVTVTDTALSPTDDHTAYSEYIVDVNVFDAPPQSFGPNVNIRAALDKNTVSGGWRTRVARLNEPLHLLDKLEQAKTSSAPPKTSPTDYKPVAVTPLEF